MKDETLNEIADGMNWTEDRAMTHAQSAESGQDPRPRLKIGGCWGRATARSTGEYGWIRARALDGSCWILRGSDDPAAGSDGRLFTVPSIAAKIEQIRKHGSIDPDLWIRETGPEPQETTQYLEYLDTNDY